MKMGLKELVPDAKMEHYLKKQKRSKVMVNYTCRKLKVTENQLFGIAVLYSFLGIAFLMDATKMIG